MPAGVPTVKMVVPSGRASTPVARPVSPSDAPSTVPPAPKAESSVPSGSSRMKVNVIPDTVVVEVDIRTLPGEGPDEVDAHLRAALGDLATIKVR